MFIVIIKTSVNKIIHKGNEVENLKFDEIVELFIEEKKRNLEVAKQAIKDNPRFDQEVLKEVDSSCYGLTFDSTRYLEDNVNSLTQLVQELSTIETLHLDNEDYGFTKIEFEHEVDGWAEDGGIAVEGVDTFAQVSSIFTRSLEEITDFENYKVKNDFKVFITKYTAPGDSKGYYWKPTVDCKVLEMYKEGSIDLKTLATITHGSCKL